MGTKIYDENGIHVKRFFGGNDRGVCWSFYGEAELDIEDFAEYISILQHSLDELYTQPTIKQNHQNVKDEQNTTQGVGQP